MASQEDGPGDAAAWDITAGLLLDRLDYPRGEDGRWPEYPKLDPDTNELAEAAALLGSKDIPADLDSVRRLAAALWEAKLSFARLMQRRAGCDYGPDAYPSKFPLAGPKPGPGATDAETVGTHGGEGAAA